MFKSVLNIGTLFVFVGAGCMSPRCPVTTTVRTSLLATTVRASLLAQLVSNEVFCKVFQSSVLLLLLASVSEARLIFPKRVRFFFRFQIFNVRSIRFHSSYQPIDVFYGLLIKTPLRKFQTQQKKRCLIASFFEIYDCFSPRKTD